MNTSITNTFDKGFSFDTDNNFEKNDSAQKLLNGVIYSVDGRYSFKSVKGSAVVYQNPNIVKYLGAHSFKDEFLAFCKILKTEDLPVTTTEITTFNITTEVFSVVSNDGSPIAFTNEFTENSNFETNTYTEITTISDPNDFELNFSCVTGGNEEISFSDYYKNYNPSSGFTVCQVNNTNVPENNADYFDAFYLFKKDNQGNLQGTLIWYGYQNWPLDAKITTEGVEENQFNKKVYYTDAFNPRRLVNIKDSSLYYRGGEEFNQVIDNVLLQPEIDSITTGGQLPSMKVFYLYRIISQNGQLSNFSPASEFINIIPEEIPIDYRGGEVSENTGKKVTINCPIINVENSSEIECFAIEYEAFGAPTGIKRLGLKPAKSIVSFDHFGNEDASAFVTLDDITASNNIWKYCNDFYSEKNKLVAIGLRNDPLPTIFNQLDYLLPLHSWNQQGETHNCLYNPEPWNYNLIDPTITDSYFYIRKKLYKTLSVFGPTTIVFRNIDTDASIELILNDISIDRYTDITEQVLTWLLFEQDNNLDWETFFPNLSIVNSQNQIFMNFIDGNIATNMNNYVFESSNNQFIEDFSVDIFFNDITVDQSNLVRGGQSIGFNEGTGIRITYRNFKEPLLNQAQAEYNGSDNLLDFYKPTEEMYAMKGEIYRLGFGGFNNDSTNLFTIPLGDIMVPNIGDFINGVDNSGNPFFESKRYVNQSVENGILYGHGIKLHIEVRLSCELQKFIPMYQLMYVERTAENRTILCQGISAPLMRQQHNDLPQNKIPDTLLDKWCLPYWGGPVYERQGFFNYDTDGEDFNLEGGTNPNISNRSKRVMHHRGFMYFDSPDLYFNKLSSQNVEDCSINIIGKLKTDHTSNIIMNSGIPQADMASNISGYFAGEEVYPKFSRKIKRDIIGNVPSLEDLPREVSGSGSSNNFFEDYFINVSVYSDFQHHVETKEIEKARSMNRGEVIGGSVFNLFHGVSNNALTISYQPWFFGLFQRQWDYADSGDSGSDRSSLMRLARTSVGYNSVFIKTTEDLFTDEFVGPWLPAVKSQIWNGGSKFEVNDTIPLINLYKNNRDSVYGGRTAEAYTRNTYIAFSKTIPVLQNSDAVQYFDSGIDTYTSLNIRLKNDFSDEEETTESIRNCPSPFNIPFGTFTSKARKGAWIYSCVLETQVEPKLTYDFENYRISSNHIFDRTKDEVINPAYFNINNLKSFITKPFNYKDDPNQVNEIAVSNVKLAGESFDNWTVFKVNNFYGLLDKNKGAATNIVKFKDVLMVVQEHQTSIIYLGVDRLITDEAGNPINIKQGSGTIVEGHKVLSEYGTSIRRAVSVSEYGVAFFDERKNEFIKNDKPMFFERDLALFYNEKFKNNAVVDTECFYDPVMKQTNVCVTQAEGERFIISFNEANQIFNGEHEYESNLFVEFDNKLFVPKFNRNLVLSNDLHQLNEGDPLRLLGNLRNLVLGFHIQGNLENIIQHRNLNIITDISYAIQNIFIKSNLGYERNIDDKHPWYKIREGVHSVPTVNQGIVMANASMVRGSWIYVEFTIQQRDNKEIKISGVVQNIRLSHR